MKHTVCVVFFCRAFIKAVEYVRLEKDIRNVVHL
jgi:hypothetical protein